MLILSVISIILVIIIIILIILQLAAIETKEIPESWMPQICLILSITLFVLMIIRHTGL